MQAQLSPRATDLLRPRRHALALEPRSCSTAPPPWQPNIRPPIRQVPVTKKSVIPILIAALVPLVCVAATQVPFSEILGTVKGLLLL